MHVNKEKMFIAKELNALYQQFELQEACATFGDFN